MLKIGYKVLRFLGILVKSMLALKDQYRPIGNEVSIKIWRSFPDFPLTAFVCHALSKSRSSFRKPSVVCCEEGSTKTLIMTDTNNGRLKMITTYACIILKTFLKNLRKLLSAFNGQQMMLVVLMTLVLTQAYLYGSFFMSKQCVFTRWRDPLLRPKIRNSFFHKAYPRYVSHLNVWSPWLSSREYSNANYAGFQLGICSV